MFRGHTSNYKIVNLLFEVDVLLNNAGIATKNHPHDPPDVLDTQEMIKVSNSNTFIEIYYATYVEYAMNKKYKRNNDDGTMLQEVGRRGWL